MGTTKKSSLLLSEDSQLKRTEAGPVRVRLSFASPESNYGAAALLRLEFSLSEIARRKSSAL